MCNKSCDLEGLNLLQTNQDINLQDIDFPDGKRIETWFTNVSLQYASSSEWINLHCGKYTHIYMRIINYK